MHIEKDIIELEKRWAAAIQKQEELLMTNFLSDNYFLAIAIQGMPLKIVPRLTWLENLKFYKTDFLNIDDINVNVYGTTAVVSMLFTQKATVRGQDRSGQFMITDIWVKQDIGWRVTERHSSRPESAIVPNPLK